MYKIPANIGFATNLVHYLPSCHSTNEAAVLLLAQGQEEGTVVITDNQTHGVGQRGNSWQAEPYKNLTFTLVLKPSFLEVKNQFKLTQAVSLALSAVVQSYVSKIVQIKWPNDIYVGTNKIGGILIQNTIKASNLETSLVGIGLNINQTDFNTLNATSLAIQTSITYGLNTILTRVLQSIATYYIILKNGNASKLNKEYISQLLGVNQFLKFKTTHSFTGKIIGTDPLGRLLIETDKGVKSFDNQEVTFLNLSPSPN